MLAGGLAVTYFLQHAAFNTSRQAQEDYFNYQAREVVLRIEQRLAAYEQVLLGTKGLFAASKGVDRNEFRNYVAALQLAKQYPGIQGVGFSLIISLQEKARHIEVIHKLRLAAASRKLSAADYFTRLDRYSPTRGNFPCLGGALDYSSHVEPAHIDGGGS